MKRTLLFITAIGLGLAQFASADDKKPEEKGRPAPRSKNSSARNVPAAARTQASHTSGGGRTVIGYRAQQRAGFPHAQSSSPKIYQPEGNRSARSRTSDSPRRHLDRPDNVVNQQAETAARGTGNRGQNANGSPNFRSGNSRANFTVQERAARRASHGGNWNSNGGLHFAEARRRHGNDRHPRSYWRSHYNRIVLFGGGYYFYDAGYWYPAYGYDSSYNRYSYDGPIYGYNGLAPEQVLVNVQVALQQDGYYRGEIDGDIGPQTRSALAAYQEENGLEVTAAIDPATLASLGLS